MSVSAELGRQTASLPRSCMQKQALTIPNWLLKGGLKWGGGALGLSTLNELLASGGLPHFRYGDPTNKIWSPQLQGARNATTSGFLGRLGNFIKRPIQTLAYGGNSIAPDPLDYVSGGMPKLDMKPDGVGPDGKPIFTFSGRGTPTFAPEYYAVQKLRQQLGVSPSATAPTTPAPQAPPINKRYYIMGQQPPGLSPTF